MDNFCIFPTTVPCFQKLLHTYTPIAFCHDCYKFLTIITYCHRTLHISKDYRKCECANYLQFSLRQPRSSNSSKRTETPSAMRFFASTRTTILCHSCAHDKYNTFEILGFKLRRRTRYQRVNTDTTIGDPFASTHDDTFYFFVPAQKATLVRSFGRYTTRSLAIQKSHK